MTSLLLLFLVSCSNTQPPAGPPPIVSPAPVAVTPTTEPPVATGVTDGNLPGEIAWAPDVSSAAPTGDRFTVTEGKVTLTIENENPFITRDDITSAFDASYAELGIADPAIDGWTVIIQDGQSLSSAFTNPEEGFKRFTVSISGPLVPYALPHEATHVLMGRVSSRNWLPGFVAEFVASAAETKQPPNSAAFDYEVINRDVLRLPVSTGDFRPAAAIGAGPSAGPLDGLRYELLRAGAKKIGPTETAALSHDIIQAAALAQRTLSVDELAPLFTKHGLGDCVLMKSGMKPGAYSQAIMSPNGLLAVRMVIGSNGIEQDGHITNVSFAYTKGGKTAYNVHAEGMDTNVFGDDQNALATSWADGAVVTINNATKSYSFVTLPNGHRSLEAVTSKGGATKTDSTH